MSSFAVAAMVWALITVSGLLGLFLKTRLAPHYTTELSRDMIGGVVGLLTLLLALVLGLLIWTAFGVFSTQQRELEGVAAKALEFNLEMRHYGPEGDAAREGLRQDLISARQQFWGDDREMAASYDASYKAMADLNRVFERLDPKTDAQKALLAMAKSNYAAIGEDRLLMSLQVLSPVVWPLIYAVAGWSCLMFAGMGLLSRPNAATIVMLILGAASVSVAILLILEFSRPYTSSIRISPIVVDRAIVDLGKPTGPGDSH
ncbi:bestrophin-like domain [Roseiarcus sp.]|uniref:bestrophin-like domain n=1 Tax=Roseiarcus sp. TaxID=1969460 RepID=UPI003F9B70C1